MARVISIVLAVLMVFSVLSVTASADSKSLSTLVAKSGYEKNKDSNAVFGQVTYDELATYEEYLAANSSVAEGKEHIVIDASSLLEKSEGAKLLDGSKYPVESGKNYDKVILTDESDDVTFKFNLKSAGKYNIVLNYYTVAGKDINISRELQINGEIPFENVGSCNFTRCFTDKLVERKDGTVGFKIDYYGNEMRPDQVEIFEWRSAYITDSYGYVTEPLEFFFKKGENTISLNGVAEPVIIGSIEIVPFKKTIGYDEYIKQYSGKDYDGEEIIIEGESALYKSDKTLYPSVDVSTASTSSGERGISAYVQTVNITGGSSWAGTNQAITWVVGDNVKEGLYAINFKYRQNVNDGMNSPRRLYVNGEVPFTEAKALEFGYSREWKMHSPQKADKSQCLVYLKPGDEITLETTLSELGDYLSRTNDVLTSINEIYRKIIKITSTEPDKNRDYQLDELIPEDIEAIGQNAQILQEIVDGITAYAGEKSSGLAIIDTLIRQMTKMYEDPDEIAKELSYFKTNVGSLGTWLNSASSIPLEIDYISLSKPGTEIKSPEANFFQNMMYGINRFISSFTVDYNAIGNDREIDADDENTITVWMAGGRDQFQVLRQLINSTYTVETGNLVNLELVNMGAILPAVVSGIAPDVAIDQMPAEPVNFALRNSIYDLKNFKDDKGVEGSKWDISYDELFAKFHPRSLEQYTFDRKGFGKEEDIGIYAVPERQDYLVMYYRTDVLAAEEIPVPETWGQLVSTITALNKKNLEFGMPTVGTSTFYAMLKQMGGDLYREDAKSTDLQTDEAIKAFKQWTNFYVNYDLPLTYDFKNRFRTGEMPLGIDNYTLYNTLAVSAPEIKGRWGYTLIPGTERVDENGNKYIDHTSGLGTNCAVILLDNVSYDLSWKFLKWWVSTDTQASFGNQIESILGRSSRYNTANLDAFDKLPWTTEEKVILNEQLSWADPIPQIAGSYFIERHINNAFRKVVYKEKDAKDTLYDYSNIINAEIIKKRAEFGLPNLEED
ncbi:MAG: extracellular solute-binding protein [Clostridia bacterium]|nr:extracellular solute-binding protein [Clostridia bacterium]